MPSTARRVRPVFRWLAGFLAIACLISALVFAYFGITRPRTSEIDWLWLAVLEAGMGYVFGYAALRGRDPYGAAAQESRHDAC
jgi:hypothetical protein